MNRAVPAAIITAVGLGALGLVPFVARVGCEVVGRRHRAQDDGARQCRAHPAPRTTTTAPSSPGTSSATTPDDHLPDDHCAGDLHPDPHAHRRRRRQPVRHGAGAGDADGQPDHRHRGRADARRHQRSPEISQQAEPILRQEALQAQSAQIDLVSGATFTSESYAQSLQAALDQANR